MAREPKNDPAAATPKYSPASLKCTAAYPVRVLATSVGTAWASLLFDHVEARDQCDPFDTSPTVDLTLVAAISGRHRVEAYGRGHWRAAMYEPGAAGMIAPGEGARLRWNVLDPSRRFEMAHLHLPHATLEETYAELRRVGQRAHERPLDALVFRDPTISQLMRSLLIAMRAGAPDLYADQVGRTLVTHLLVQHSPWLDVANDNRDPGVISDHRLARVVEYMSAHLDRPLTVLALAREAGISVHHFSRRFREQTGRTPYGFVTDLRFDLARRLLRTTDLSVADIGARCGYTHAAAFTASFQRRFGTTPTADRRHSRTRRQILSQSR